MGSIAGRRSLLKVIGAVVFLATVGGVGIFLAGKDRSKQQRSIVVAQVGDFFLYAPLYVAIDGGYFADQGLNVQISSTGGDDKTWAAVVSGSAQFGVADPTFVAISAERGQPGQVVASIVNGVPFWGVTFRTDIPEIKEGRDLAGLTVATFPAPSTAYTLQAKMFRDAGLEPRIREGGFGTLLQILNAKESDIALELEPNVSQAVASGGRVLYSLSKLYGDFAITGLTALPSTIRDDPELVAKVTLALEHALSDLHNNPTRCLQYLSKRFPDIKSDVATAALKRAAESGVIPQHTLVARTAWDQAIQVRKDVGDLKGNAPYETFVNVFFAEQASRQLNK